MNKNIKVVYELYKITHISKKEEDRIERDAWKMFIGDIVFGSEWDGVQLKTWTVFERRTIDFENTQYFNYLKQYLRRSHQKMEKRKATIRSTVLFYLTSSPVLTRSADTHKCSNKLRVTCFES